MTATVTVPTWSRATVVTEKISDLVFDWSLYPRKEVDHKTVVRNYARAMKAGCVFPTVKVGLFEGKKIIVDGLHRVRARELNDETTVECSELPFQSHAELFAEAVRLNSEHGKPFSDLELKDNITKLKKFKFTVKDIVTFTHVPANEIYRESAAPIAVLRAPWGANINTTHKPDPSDLLEFKNALRLCLKWFQFGHIPTDNAEMMSLVLKSHLASGKVLGRDG